MSDAAGAAIVLIPGIDQEAPDRPLEAILGSAAGALRAELVSKALALTSEIGIQLCRAPAGAGSLSEQVSGIFAEQTGPLLVIWPCLPRLSSQHIRGALEDLRSGADIVLGPVIGGGLYLLGLPRPLPAVTERIEQASASEAASSVGATVAAELGLELGFLAPERSLRSCEDVAAVLADPLTPEEIRRLLEPAVAAGTSGRPF